MPAIVGLVLSYASLVAGLPATGGDAAAADICAPGDACAPAAIELDLTAYATPAEVDCRAVSDGAGVMAALGRTDVVLLSGGCSEQAFDFFHYRVSRFADSERSPGGFGPERARRAVRSTETVTGLPPDHGALASASGPPIAIYAYTLIPVPPQAPERIVAAGDGRAPQRIVEPPDRPPRV